MIDTPGIEHGANLLGKRVNPGRVLYAPERVAAAVVEVARRPRAEVAVGFPAGWARFAYGVAPLPTEAVIGAVARRAMDRASLAPRTEGTVMRPGPEGRRASSGWLDRPGAVEMGRAGNVALLAAGAALALGTLAWASRRARV